MRRSLVLIGLLTITGAAIGAISSDGVTARVGEDDDTTRAVVADSVEPFRVSVATGDRPDAQDAAAAGPRTVWDGLYTEAQAARGKEAYMKACAECHMPDLGGHEYAGALAGYGFQLKWEDASLAEVYGRLGTMPLGRGGTLGGQEYLDITSFVLQSNGYPAGAQELEAAVAGQRWPRIAIERKRGK